MRLRTRIILVFGLAFVLMLALVYGSVFAAFQSLTDIQMKSHARTFAGFLVQRIQSRELDQQQDLRERLRKVIADAAMIAREGQSFAVDKIILVNPDFSVLAGYPAIEEGKSYRGHDDIREAFISKTFAIVMEEEVGPDGKKEKSIDIVAHLDLAGQRGHVLEIKLGFDKTRILLDRQIGETRFLFILGLFVALGSMLGVLLYMIERAAVRPAIATAHALERVRQGDLTTTLAIASRDEFGRMAGQFNAMVVGLRERFHLNRYVSNATREAVSAVASGSVGDNATRRRVLTILFSDIRGFTSYSESRDPVQIVAVLNRILGIQAEIIRRNGGDIDKFVADETMAVFVDEQSALRSAWEIQREIAAQAGTVDHLTLGIGVYSGNVVQGDVGSAEMRDYTVIGDAVNTAARLQSVAGSGEILVSVDMVRHPEVAASFRFEEVGDIVLKGKQGAVNTWRMTGIEGGDRTGA